VTAAQLNFQKGQLYQQDGARAEHNELPFDNYLTLFNNSVATFTVKLEPALYQVEVYGQNDEPGPVDLLLFANQFPLGKLSFALNDNSWENRCVWLHPIYWSTNTAASSTLSLAIHFINDGGPGGNRDASIALLTFVPLQAASTSKN
jgi:hypothetical protein